MKNSFFAKYIFFYNTIVEIICIFIRAYHFIDFQDIFILCSSWDELILSLFQVKIFQSMKNISESPLYVCRVYDFLSFQLHEICKIIYEREKLYYSKPSKFSLYIDSNDMKTFLVGLPVNRHFFISFFVNTPWYDL